MASDEIPEPWMLELLTPPKRFDPTQTLRMVEYHFDELRRALASGYFRPAVRQAQMLAELVRLAALAEERDFERTAHSVSHRFHTPEPGA